MTTAFAANNSRFAIDVDAFHEIRLIRQLLTNQIPLHNGRRRVSALLRVARKPMHRFCPNSRRFILS